MSQVDKAAPDWERIEESCKEADLPEVVYVHLGKSGEAFVSGLVRAMLVANAPEKLLFDDAAPKIIRWEPEFPVPRGRVDYALFHVDGSMTVCEVKDGRRGLQSVLAGVGQVISYGVQVGMSNAGLRKVRKALIFSSCWSAKDEALIVMACEEAGVIAVPLGSENAHREGAAIFLSKVLGNDK